MATLALAALLSLAAGGPQRASLVPPEIRIVRAYGRAPRYLRLRSWSTEDGVRGEETSVTDLATGRYVDRVAAGALSHSEGFDGERVWSTDATGMPLVEGNADARLDQLAWAHFYGRRGPERPRVRLLRGTSRTLVVRLAYRALSAPIDVTLDRLTGLVTSIRDDTGVDPATIRLSDYRRVGQLVIPFSIAKRTRYGSSVEMVRSAVAVDRVEPAVFDPPAEPHDVELSGTTAVAMMLRAEGAGIPVRIGNGPPLRMLLDTGSTNFLTPAAARRSGLRAVGNGVSGGVGPGVVAERYAIAKTVRIGAAVLHDQPFSVLEDRGLGFDGVVGCELFQRLAVRFDFENRLVRLARDARDFGPTGTVIRIRLAGCTPEADGSLDGMPGALGIDTGDWAPLDVMTPFVRRNDLVARYRALRLPPGRGGIGGDTQSFLAVAHHVRLGPVSIRGTIPMLLDDMTSGALSDPTEMALVGLSLLRRCELTFDYRGGRMWLRACSGTVLDALNISD
jgi:Aspartyl protease